MSNIKHNIGVSTNRKRNREIRKSEIKSTDSIEKKSELANYFHLKIKSISLFQQFENSVASAK